MRTIYLIELEGGKYFLHATTEVSHPIELFLETYLLFDYVQKYKPINVLDTWVETHPLDLDIQVKKQMLEKGIHHVRGGSYSSIDFTPSQLLCLETEFTSQLPAFTHKKNVINEILNKYFFVNTSFHMDLKTERNRLETNYHSLLKEKQKYDELCQIDIPEARRLIDWMENTCQEQADRRTPTPAECHTEITATYRRAIDVLHLIYKTFLNISNDSSITDRLWFEHPEFIFDDFMYTSLRVSHHSHPNACIKLGIFTPFRMFDAQSNRSNPFISDRVAGILNENGSNKEGIIEMDTIHTLCDKYRYLLLCIENRKEESKFDVSSWKSEEYYQYAICLLDFFIHEPTR